MDTQEQSTAVATAAASDPYLSIQDIASYLKVSTSTARRIVHDNNWPFIETAPGKPGSLIRVRESVVYGWASAQERAQQQTS